MTTVTLPPETCAVLADIEDGGTVWIRVKGERRVGAGGQAVSITEATHPPADLAALLDARCENCDGQVCMACRLRDWWADGPDGHDCGRHACPDCVDPGRWKLNALLPVIEGSPSLADGVEVVIIDHEPPGVLLWNDDGCEPITITGSAPVPGDWVAQITKETP